MNTDLMEKIQQAKIDHAYQPLWDIETGKVFGYEALLRSMDESFNGTIEQVFMEARKAGTLYELDTLSIFAAASRFPFEQIEENVCLFINVFPSTMIHEDFPDYIDQLLADCPQIREKVVFEVNESGLEADLWDASQLLEQARLLKAKGFRIALDDIGEAAADLKKIAVYTPDYIKLDRFFAKGLSVTPEKQEKVSQLAGFQDIDIVLEGIEEEDDLKKAKDLHIRFVQGYLLGKPKKLSAERTLAM